MSASFDPQEITLLATVLDRACKELKIRDGATKVFIASRIISLAEEGERDLEKLLRHAKSSDRVPDAQLRAR